MKVFERQEGRQTWAQGQRSDGWKMASQQVEGAVIQRTKDTLGKVIKKPPLTDKLLSRPPFRYLHDIISEVSCGD